LIKFVIKSSAGFTQTAINFINRNRKQLNGRNYFSTLYRFKNFNTKNKLAAFPKNKRTEAETLALKKRYQRIYQQTQWLKILAILAIFIFTLIFVIVKML